MKNGAARIKNYIVIKALIQCQGSILLKRLKLSGGDLRTDLYPSHDLVGEGPGIV